MASSRLSAHLCRGYRGTGAGIRSHEDIFGVSPATYCDGGHIVGAAPDAPIEATGLLRKER